MNYDDLTKDAFVENMVWSFALLACGHPTVVRTGALSVSVKGPHLVAYCSNTKPATIQALKERPEGHHGSAVVLTWAPQALEDIVINREAPLSIVAVPGNLQRAFKQGNAAERDDDAGLPATEALPAEVET